MDNLKEYIKQCEKAKQIQKLRKKWEWGDIYITIINERSYETASPCIALSIDNDRDKCEVWLPRQDQLQKLIIKLFTPFGLLKDFYKWCSSDALDYHQRGNWSMEQLWLGYIMKEKFNKTWNGEDWICIKKLS